MTQLKSFRQASGLTAKAMAERLGVSLSLYNKVEGDERLPSQNFLARFKAAFPTFDMNIFFDREHYKQYSESKERDQ